MDVKEIFKHNVGFSLPILLWFMVVVFLIIKEVNGGVWLPAVVWFLDIGIVYLFYHAWKCRSLNPAKATLLISLAVFTSAAMSDYPEEILPYFIMLLSPAFVLYVFDLIAGDRIEKGAKRFIFGCVPSAIILLLTYLNCDGSITFLETIVFILVIAAYSAAYNFKVQEKKGTILWSLSIASWLLVILWTKNERTYMEVTWNTWFITALPFIYTVLFRKIADFVQGKKRYIKIAGLYYIACIVLFVFMGGYIFREYPYAGLSWQLDNGCYMVLLAIMICIAEGRHWKDNSLLVRERKVSAIFPVLYAVIALAVTFLENERFRTVIFNVGGPAVGISESVRQDWWSYRIDLIRQFLNGTLESGYMNSTQLGQAAFKFGISGILAVCIPLIILIILLICIRWKDKKLNRVKNYLAVSYLIRGFISAAYCVLVMPVSRLPFPFFTTYGVIADVLILYYLLKEHKLTDCIS